MVDTNLGYLLDCLGHPTTKARATDAPWDGQPPSHASPLDAEEAGLWQPRSALDADPPTTSPTMEWVSNYPLVCWGPISRQPRSRLDCLAAALELRCLNRSSRGGVSGGDWFASQTLCLGALVSNPSSLMQS